MRIARENLANVYEALDEYGYGCMCVLASVCALLAPQRMFLRVFFHCSRHADPFRECSSESFCCGALAFSNQSKLKKAILQVCA